MDITKHKNRIGMFLVAAVVAAVGVISLLHRPSMAADLRNFDPGNIISDEVMRDKNSMSEQQIQNFLNWKNPCNNTNTQLANHYPHLHYNIRDGKFVCMAQESFDGESAAHIIWRAAQDYNINPKVLIVMLEKEQGLITDTWPNHIQYRSAMGYGCPDTAACDSQYYGLKNQIRWASHLFNTVLNGGWSNYPVGYNYVQYNQNKSCGGSVINIRNRATSALYRYTPYQPNQSALNAGYGTGDSCGAYGNRNFWLFFNDWFGSTTSWRDMATPSNVTMPENTEFVIRNSQNMLFDVNGSDSSNGAKIVSWSFTGNSNQRFTFEKTNNNLYIIRSKLNGKVLDLSGSGTGNGTVLQLWDHHGGCNQNWSVIQKGNGKYQLLTACNSAKAIDLNPRDLPGARPVIYDRNNGIFQELVLEELAKFIEKNGDVGSSLSDNKLYTIQTSGNTFFSTNADGSVFASGRSASLHQTMQIKKIADRLYTIRQADRYLALRGGSTANGTALQFRHSDGGSCNQQWRINKKLNGKFTIVSACDMDVAIDVNPPNINNTPVLTYVYHGQAVQEFTITAAGEVNNPSVDINSLAGKTLSIRNTRELALDVVGSDNRNGAWVGSWTVTNGNNQHFRFEKAAGFRNQFVIRSTLSGGRVLDLPGSEAHNGATLQLWDYHGGCNQRWVITKKANGSYNIASACAQDKALDLNPMNLRGTRPVLYTKHGGAVQEWTFKVE